VPRNTSSAHRKKATGITTSLAINAVDLLGFRDGLTESRPVVDIAHVLLIGISFSNREKKS
jgi:hypothetical protein